ncbi:regulator of G-protein signaling 7-like isoform X2 [Clavelina lepadiformis]|uniref:regulator of G-protein signaling 7-like isoform X2 n=1 Tax=Clavelina lepadiformis TaxID=159417 RepID=UPI004042322E
MSKKLSQEALRTQWQKALEGVLLKRPTDLIVDNSTFDLNDGVIIDIKDLEDQVENGKADTSDVAINLKHPPRQSVYTKLSALLVEMQHETEGVQTFRQNFRALRDTSCKVNCKEREKNQKDGVPDAFWTTELIRWLKQVLNIECDLEACHLATMLCKTGYIYPCNVQWNTVNFKISEPDGNMVFRYQTPFYWPNESQFPLDQDHASHLLMREANNHGIPMDEYEIMCLSRLKKVLKHQWDCITQSALTQTSFLEGCCPSDQYINAWQNYAFWRVRRPPAYYKYICKAESCLNGPNRNFPSFTETSIVPSENDKEKKTAMSPSKILTSSCKRIITSCLEREEIDPFLIKDESFFNPWKSETIRNAWPKEATESTGPYKLQCKAWGMSFDALLKDELGQLTFEKHLKKEFSEENLAFYLDCIYLRSAPLKELEDLIQSIFSEFISPNGATPVNIDTQTLNAVKAEMKTKTTRFVFDLALEHIYKLMKKDSYKRFPSSKLFKETLETAIVPQKPEKEKGKLPKIWRLSQFLTKGKEEDPERGENNK